MGNGMYLDFSEGVAFPLTRARASNPPVAFRPDFVYQTDYLVAYNQSSVAPVLRSPWSRLDPPIVSVFPHLPEAHLQIQCPIDQSTRRLDAAASSHRHNILTVQNS